MKLLQSEYKQLCNLIEKANKTVSEYNFTKKRGWVTVSEIETDKTFTFFRSNETKLNSQQQFEKVISYHIKMKEKEIAGLSLDEFLNNFEDWLSLL